MNTVAYFKLPARYRFAVAQPFELDTGITLDSDVGNAFVRLGAAGRLFIAAGYAWDGASGPIAQTTDIIRGSLVHDALYQLMREGLLGQQWRMHADALLREMCVTDGMPRWQAEMVHAAVSAFGERYSVPPPPPSVLIAPVPIVPITTADWIAP